MNVTRRISGTKTNDFARICLVVLMTSMVVSMLVLPVAAAQAPFARVEGNTLPMLMDSNVERKGKPSADKKLFVVVSLNIESTPKAESTINLLSKTPQKPKGEQKYGLVKSYLKGSGLKIVEEFSDLSAVWVEGTVAQVEKAFKVSIGQYKLDGKEFFANDKDPYVPVEIADAVVAVAGLENYVAYEPLLTVGSSASQADINPNAEAVGPPYDPYEIRSAYLFNTLYTSGSPNKLTGKGINVAIIDAYGDPTMAVDWTHFNVGTVGGGAGPWSGGQLPSTPAISIFYPSGAPVSSSAGWALETAMDVEWVHAIAPDAKINLIVSKDNSFTYMLAAFQWTITNSKGAVISMSFGARESYLSAAYINAWSTASRSAAKKSVTMLASSGDAGSDAFNIIHPASDLYTVAVGGTSLSMTGTYPGTWSSETAWTGSGGGKSILFAKPSWQYGTNVPLDGVRDIPDVALVANPSTGVYVHCDSYSVGGWWLVGGTSLSAPIWAAFIAIVDQAVGASASAGGIGYADPWLYRVFRSSDYLNCFHDITIGNNGGYTAGTAYDLVTGIGTLKAWNLVNAGVKYLRMAQNITYIPGAKAIAVTSAGKMYIGTYQRPPGVSWPYMGVLYALDKGSTTPNAIFKAAGGITDIAVDAKNGVYVMTHTTLYKYNSTTGVLSTLATGLTWGWGVAVDKNLNVYFTDDATVASGGGLYWIPKGGIKQLLKSLNYPIGVTVDSSLNVYTSNGTYIHLMNPAHTTWTSWKKMYASLDIALDSRKTAYASDFTSLDIMDDYKFVLQGTAYDENLWLDSKTGIYYVDWNWGYGATTGNGWVRYLPPETPT